MGAGPHKSHTTNSKGCAYTVVDKEVGSLWDFPKQQAVQSSVWDLGGIGILHVFSTSARTYLVCHRAYLLLGIILETIGCCRDWELAKVVAWTRVELAQKKSPLFIETEGVQAVIQLALEWSKVLHDVLGLQLFEPRATLELRLGRDLDTWEEGLWNLYKPWRSTLEEAWDLTRQKGEIQRKPDCLGKIC